MFVAGCFKFYLAQKKLYTSSVVYEDIVKNPQVWQKLQDN